MPENLKGTIAYCIRTCLNLCSFTPFDMCIKMPIMIRNSFTSTRNKTGKKVRIPRLRLFHFHNYPLCEDHEANSPCDLLHRQSSR